MRTDTREHILHIPNVVDQIRQDNGVESLVKRQFMRVGLNKRQVGMALTGLRDHLARKIDANANGWLKRRQ